MRITWVGFESDPDSSDWRSGFKGVATEIEFAAGVVLFGPNDVGKSNILEALKAVSDPDQQYEAVRQPPDADDETELSTQATFLLELDGVEREGSADAWMLAQLIQFATPQITMGSARPDPQVRAARWTLEEDGFALAFSTRPRRLRTLKRDLAGAISESGASSCRDWGRVERAFGAVLDTCLGSRWIAVRVDTVDNLTNVFLFTPPPDRVLPEQYEAARELASQTELWPEGRVPVLHEAMSAICQERFGVFLPLSEFPTFRPFEMVEFDETASETAGVESLVEREVGAIALRVIDAVVAHCAKTQQRPVFLVRSHEEFGFPRIWLDGDEASGVRIHPVVVQMCSRVSQIASDLAPAFVKSRYSIQVEAVPVSEWLAGASRVKAPLWSPARRRIFPLEVTSAGTATWARYATAEAVRVVAEQTRSLLELVGSDTFEADLANLTGTDTSNLIAAEGGFDLRAHDLREYVLEAQFRVPSVRDSLLNTHSGEKKRRRSASVRPHVLYMFDEPERHLHPLAQEQAAMWVGDLIARGARVILATHSPPFLDLRTSDVPEDADAGGGLLVGARIEDVNYLRAFRDDSGLTRTESLSNVLAQHLDEQAELLGLSRAQLVQILRAVLVVEGAHDERVIEHFYGPAFRQDRIQVLPLRGTTKSKLLAEAEFLRALRLPMILLFDNTADSASAENRDIRRLYEHWPKNVPPPALVRFVPRDIWLTLPNEHVARALQVRWGVSFPGWQELLRRFDTSKDTNLKAYILKALKLPPRADGTPIGPDEFLDEILQEVPDKADPSAELRAAIEQVRALGRSTEQWYRLSEA